ncbi:MAG: ABC-three component system protein [Acidobacteriaceae bacterium]
MNPSKPTTSIPLTAIPTPPGCAATVGTVTAGQPILPQHQVMLYSAGQWEEFVNEWAHGQKAKYKQVVRFAGAGDQGVDVAGFTDDNGLTGVWDGFQCKHYNDAITPADAYPEIAKVLWHSFNGAYAVPRKYYFMAPKACGASLGKLLLKAAALKAAIVGNWDSKCANAVTKKQTIALTGVFARYVSNFDFSIFAQKPLLELIDEHRATPYFATRFGGGLKPRPKPDAPPDTVHANESRYVEQLYEAYSDHRGTKVTDLKGLTVWPSHVQHFHRQREHFYHAEALRNFARDTVPPGTFEDLQSEVYAGVADVEAKTHSDALVRLNAVTQVAQELHLTSNALLTVVKVQDRRGICHQLANEDRLSWKK